DDLPDSISRVVQEERARTRGELERAAQEGRQINLEIRVPSPIEEIERRAIEATLDYTGGDKTRAARALGIGRKTLYRKLQQYNGTDAEAATTGED
ncbi:MAG TPA: helix-turn-helix domain-containing protein, partial [Pyrinomonadaceae bacterium]|nr:helix-turn-helix domain-containing protein [Pyrinomonadaceae bacterium]